MSIHHQAALNMARSYQANPDARNTFLRLLNVDIMTDQSQEIALMRRIVESYPGDADAVPVPASMIHGMEGMEHPPHAEPGGATQQPAMEAQAGRAMPTEPLAAGASSSRSSRATVPAPDRGHRTHHQH